jgi:serine/threonine protein phosphatase PrpC
MASYEDVISDLLKASHRVHPERIGPLLAEQLPRLGMRDVALYLADLDQQMLVCVPGEGLPERTPLSIDNTDAGLAFRTETAVDGEQVGTVDAPAIRLWVPLIDGAERLGVLAVSGVADKLLRKRAWDVASLAATMIVAKQPYGDGLVNIRRQQDMRIAAELRWDALPPLTYVNNQVEISGLLEPVYRIAGDTFDYALNDNLAHLAVFDAMGHGLEASRIANLAVACYRNGRRRGLTLEDLFSLIDETVSSAFGPEKFVTGQLATLDMAIGQLEVLNAGHPPPILVRGNEAVAVAAEPSMPFGLGDLPSRRTRLPLEDHDVILFFTDGVIEGRAPDGELFGWDRLAKILVEALKEGPLAESARKLAHAVVEHQRGELQDDATLLLVRWKATPQSVGVASV